MRPKSVSRLRVGATQKMLVAVASLLLKMPWGIPFGRRSGGCGRQRLAGARRWHHRARGSPAAARRAATSLLERRFRAWRIEDDEKHAGPDFSLAGGAAALVLTLLVIPTAALRFGGYGPAFLTSMPVDQRWHTYVAIWLDGAISSLSQSIRSLALGVTRGLDWALGLLETGLTQTPWPIVGAITLALAWQLAGIRVAIFTFVALTYLAVLGFWERSLQTIAIGIPLGVLSGYSKRFAAFLRPVLDFMQTMPAFVYLIPVIALFGIDKPSGIIATVIFGVPPMVRLTALGIAGVPANVREATQSFGASAFFTLRKVDLPLAMPSIRAGISQSILMCLSMVVIASLIGAQGLGEDVLRSLQYASQGQGLLAGFAILACAIVLDRLVQGRGR